MLDRTQFPAFGKIEKIDLLEPKVHHLDNGLPVFCINAGAQDVIKVELVFGIGTATDDLLTASTTVRLLTEGTGKRSAAEIAESVDFYGAHIQNEVSHDESSLSLFTLNKHLKNTIGTLAEVYSDPSFLEREVETYVLKSQQEMLVNQEKVSYLASKAFSATLFGAQHPYGRSAEVSDYEKLNRGRLIDFHQRHIHNALNHILVSGKLNDQTLVELNTHFGQASRSTHEKEIIKIGRSEKHLVHVEKADAVQNAIRMGRVLFARTHADYVGMQMLCTVLGGYFGSRLMANIREDKGYTYGINAGMVSLKNSGHLSISTEVGASVCDAAINEIHFEIERIRKDLIPTQELELVRNYMLGSILKSIDGPFNIASKWKGYIKHDLGLNAHHDLIRQVRTMTPEQLRILANKYLQKDELILITAGRSN